MCTLIHLRLSRGAFALRGAEDLLALWDEATRSEPIIRAFIDEPRWRRAEDGVPFTGAKFAAVFGTKDLTPEDETADPADIPQLVEEAIAFAKEQGFELSDDQLEAVSGGSWFPTCNHTLAS